MAKRILIRKDTAQNWYDNNPMLYPGEFGVETDTLKIKMGPLVESPAVGTAWRSITTYLNVVPSDFNTIIDGYLEVTDLNNTVAALDGSQNLLIPNDSIIFEGATADSYELTLQATDPTADRTIIIPDIDGTLITDADTGTVTNTMLAGSISNDKLSNHSVTINGYEIALGGSASYGTDNIGEGTTNLYFTNERAQDAVATALSNGTHTNITVSYNDSANSISLTGAQTYNDEMARDAIGTALIGGTGIDVTVSDISDTITIDVDNTIATKTYADNAVSTGISNLIASAPSTLDTLNELAQALGNDADFSTTVTNAIAAKVAKSGDTMTGALTLSGAPSSDLHAATKKYVDDTVSNHEADTTNVHGISDTSKIVITDSSQTLSNKTISSTNNTITITSSEISDFTEAAQDAVNTALTAGTGISKTYDDSGNTITISNSGVTSISGTSNQISASGSTGSITLSLPSAVTFPGTVTLHADPSQALHAATKQYVDGIAAGLTWKQAVSLLASSNISLSGSTNTLVIDGHDALTQLEGDGYRILLLGQSTASENGIYTYSDDGSNYTLTRSSDADAYLELEGATVFVMEGDTYAGTSWIQTNHYLSSFSNQTWYQSSGQGTYVAGNGLNLDGNNFEIDTAVTADLSSSQTLTNKTIAGTFTGGLTGDVTGNVSGNAGTVTNGVYTSGSYSNPSWITGLGWSKISSTPTTLSGYGITDAQALDEDLTAIAAISGTSGLLQKTAANTWQLDTNTYLTTSDASSTYLPLTGGTLSSDLTVTGNLTVNGTTTNINSTNLVVEDKNIVIADVASPTNITADGAGITVKGTSDKTFNWVAANTAFTSSENMDLASGKTYKINGTTVLSGSVLGSGITSSSLTSVGTLTDLTVTNTITGAVSGNAGTVTNGVYTTGSYSNPTWIASLAASKVGLGNVENTALSTWAGTSNITTLGTISTGTWSGTTIALNKGGTGATTQAGAANAILPSQSSANGKYLKSDGTDVSWATVDALPSQTGNNGKYLTTDGSSASWASLVVPIETGTATLTGNTATTISTTALSAFTSIEYMVSLKQGSKVRTSKVLLQTDGTSVDMTEFAITETGGTLSGVVISATTASTNAVLQATVTDAASTNVTVKFSKVAL